MSQRILLITAGGLAVLAIVLWSYFLFSGPRRESPETLAAAALSAAEVSEREAAAAKLARTGSEGQSCRNRVIKESKDPSVQAILIRGVAQLYDFEAVPGLLDALSDSQPAVSAAASEAVERMLGKSFGLCETLQGPERAQKIQEARSYWEWLRGTPYFEGWKERLAEKQRQTEARRKEEGW